MCLLSDASSINSITPTHICPFQPVMGIYLHTSAWMNYKENKLGKEVMYFSIGFKQIPSLPLAVQKHW